jgi:hypothetical protein
MKWEHTHILTIFVVCYKKATILLYSAFPWKYVEHKVIELIILSFLVGPLLPTQCRCKVWLLHLITHNDTHTLGRTPLDHGSAGRRGLYMQNTTFTSDKTSMLPAGFKPAIPASLRSQTHASDLAATGICQQIIHEKITAAQLAVSKAIIPPPTNLQIDYTVHVSWPITYIVPYLFKTHTILITRGQRNNKPGLLRNYDTSQLVRFFGPYISTHTHTHTHTHLND